MPLMHLHLEADIQPVSGFRSKAAAMIKQVQESRRPLILTQHGRSAAVLLDVHSYQALLQDIAELRDIRQALVEAEAGQTIPHDEARASILERHER